MAEFKPQKMNIRPLAVFTRQALEKGFELEWDDRELIALSKTMRRFRIRLTPVTERAKAAVIAASGSPDLDAIIMRTDWIEGDEELWQVAHQTGRRAMEKLREIGV